MQDFFFINDNRRCLQILFSEIWYIEAVRKYVKIFTANRAYLVQVSMNYAEEKLPVKLFCRIHKSYIISLRHTKQFDHESVSIGGMDLPIGKNYRSLLLQKADVWGKEEKTPVMLPVNDMDNTVSEVLKVLHPANPVMPGG
jgi:DNA-binding LytR/AlgR family response regulator